MAASSDGRAEVSIRCDFSHLGGCCGQSKHYSSNHLDNVYQCTKDTTTHLKSLHCTDASLTFQSSKNNFAECSDVDKTQINKPALISKIHQYKEKLNVKRGKQKEEFENEVFSIPVATSTTTASKGKLYKDELYSYKETCTSLASEMSEIQKKSVEKLDIIKSEHAVKIKENESKHKRELLSLNKTQSEELRSQTKTLRLETKRVSQKTSKLYNENEKLLEKLKVFKKSKQDLSYENILLRRKLARNNRDESQTVDVDSQTSMFTTSTHFSQSSASD
ncbi:unnamed protein product [Mytilus coruscus]|uniref:Uncharacterized protein n=1 Tax=Mytilus coruscus TaxID=42192 RepID=A0A6J8F0I7_MYTCO|nr:unnamed protein product [Mytilus coruscus]